MSEKQTIVDDNKEASLPNQQQNESSAEYLQRLETEINTPETEVKPEKTTPAEPAQDEEVVGTEPSKEDTPATEPTKEDETPAEPVETKKKTPIPDDIRKKAKIPEKFKYLEDLVSWGENAEKAYHRTDSERNKLLNENKKYREQVSALEEKLTEKIDSGQMTEEQKQQAIEDFKLKFEVDPVNALKDIFKEVVEASNKKAPKASTVESGDEEAAQQAQIEQHMQQADVEFKELVKGMSKDEIKEIIAELKEIAATEPNITSIHTLNKIRLFNKRELAEKLNSEKAEKDNQKKSGSFPAKAGKIVADDIPVSKIQKTQSLKELEQLEAEINGEE